MPLRHQPALSWNGTPRLNPSRATVDAAGPGWRAFVFWAEAWSSLWEVREDARAIICMNGLSLGRVEKLASRCREASTLAV